MADNKIGGKYKHFKGKCYEVYCEAQDKWGNRFILYRQCYGDESFWLRPYDMFFGETEVDGKTVKRFEPTTGKRKSATAQISTLITLLHNQIFTVRNSEDDHLYCITNISETREYIYVHPLFNNSQSGYLTEFEIASRMGYDILVINDNQIIRRKREKITSSLQLQIGDNDKSILEQWLNPCSVDLQIASAGFLRAKRSPVDPQSIEHISKATSLWRDVRTHTSKNQVGSYFKLRPGDTILTHTRDRIKIPEDCAGKIEIKSTYARLSLSITSGDFCNPGYDGYFPLEISNFGKHTLILHANETMAQLMLVPLSGPILVDYSRKATYKNVEGYDDGTPYTFWRERSIRSLRKQNGAQPIIELYNKVIQNIRPETTEDIAGFRERFTDTFLPFCQRKMFKHKYQRDGLPDIHKLVHAYINKEKCLKMLSKFKWGSGILTILNLITPFISNILSSSGNSPLLIRILTSPWFFGLSGVGLFFFLIITAVLFFKFPKTFCTFEKYDIDTDIKSLEEEINRPGIAI